MKSSDKYPKIRSPFSNTYKRNYVVQAEIALGKSLDSKHQIHHHSGTQLVICENQIYHRLLHDRTRALRTCGHADWRKCCFCKQYDNPKNLVFSQIKTYHKSCNAKYNRERRWEKYGNFKYV